MACNDCRVEADVEGKRVLVTIRYEHTDKLGIDPATWTLLYRCRRCGAYWELGSDQRTFEEVSLPYAREKYPTLVHA